VSLVYSKRMAAVITRGNLRAEFVGRGMIVDGEKKGETYATYELWEFRFFGPSGSQEGLPAESLAYVLSKYCDEIKKHFLATVQAAWEKEGKPRMTPFELAQEKESLVQIQRNRHGSAEAYDALDDDKNRG
jgi:hypothetical protein